MESSDSRSEGGGGINTGRPKRSSQKEEGAQERVVVSGGLAKTEVGVEQSSKPLGEMGANEGTFHPSAPAPPA